MIIKNDSPRFKKINGKLIRPWRSIVVPDEIVSEDVSKVELDNSSGDVAVKVISKKKIKRKRKEGE